MKIKRIQLNDMEAVYLFSEEGAVSFSLVPQGGDELFFEKGGADPLVQISCTGDATSIGFAAGETRHNSALTMSLKYVSQDVKRGDDTTVIETVVESGEGIKVSHFVECLDRQRGIVVYSKVHNRADSPLMIEAVSSVNICGLTPYTDDEARGRLVLHRFRSRWSAEGRHEARAIEDLLLEPSWADFAVRCEKFGTTGSMPVRGFFPFAAVEDTGRKVIWAVSLACSSSWQFETVRIDKGLSLSCGLADYDFGHWRKEIGPGEEFTTPEAYVTAARCDITEACDRLLDIQKGRLLPSQQTGSLPAIFNEYCTTWGEPSEENIGKILSVIGPGLYEYFVIDAGWYADLVTGWQDNMGDWNVASDLFPNGMKKVVRMINDAGMKAGIWFELEVVGKDSARASDPHLLTRDGKIIISGTRRFWDMRSEWVNDYLGTKVIDFLKDNGFEYIKIDYNDTIGIGCDGAESVGEGLRQTVEATKEFFGMIRRKVPGIAIEICSSGGHRLEPSFMELADYLSFSDAHEEREIPVIAADLQNLVLACKSQIWAVLRKDDEMKRIAYSICAGMFGVLCISGDVFELTKEKQDFANAGVEFYKTVSSVISDGFTHRYGPRQFSNRDLKGYQATVRFGRSGGALVIVHAFEHDGAQIVTVPLDRQYDIAGIYGYGDHRVRITDTFLSMEFDESFDAVAVYLK
ncbi:MAG: alpha-galactosidase [Lachnospiraceae bacterium]|nr:alpha-galactosidase [Lachnospiraceae bacterium]